MGARAWRFRTQMDHHRVIDFVNDGGGRSFVSGFQGRTSNTRGKEISVSLCYCLCVCVCVCVYVRAYVRVYVYVYEFL